MQESVDNYVDPWSERSNPITPGQFRTSLPLEVLPRVPVTDGDGEPDNRGPHGGVPDMGVPARSEAEVR